MSKTAYTCFLHSFFIVSSPVCWGAPGGAILCSSQFISQVFPKLPIPVSLNVLDLFSEWLPLIQVSLNWEWWFLRLESLTLVLMSKIKFWLIWGTGYLGLWELRTNESAITAFSSYCLFCCHLSSMSSKSPARGIPLHRASPLNWLLKDYGYSSWRSGVEMAGMPRWWFLPLKVMTRRATVLSGLLWWVCRFFFSPRVVVVIWLDYSLGISLRIFETTWSTFKLLF